MKVACSGVTTKKTSRQQNKQQERMKRFATIEVEDFLVTTQEELQNYCSRLRLKFNVDLIDKREGSLILTVHCRTLEILEQLWEDYCSGHLDEVVEECFHTDETKDTKDEMGEKCEAGVDTISLETTISRVDYLRCKKFLTEISGKLIS